MASCEQTTFDSSSNKSRSLWGHIVHFAFAVDAPYAVVLARAFFFSVLTAVIPLLGTGYILFTVGKVDKHSLAAQFTVAVLVCAGLYLYQREVAKEEAAMQAGPDPGLQFKSKKRMVFSLTF